MLKKARLWAWTKAFYPSYDNAALARKVAGKVGGIGLAHTLTNVVIPCNDLSELHPLIHSTQRVGLPLPTLFPGYNRE